MGWLTFDPRRPSIVKIQGIPERSTAPPLTITSPTALNSPVGEKNLRGCRSLASAFLLPGSMPPVPVLAPHPLPHEARSQGEEGAKMLMEKNRHGVASHNLPLEISLYLGSYIAALQQREVDGCADDEYTLLASLNQLVDALTDLQRILATPIPFPPLSGVHSSGVSTTALSVPMALNPLFFPIALHFSTSAATLGSTRRLQPRVRVHVIRRARTERGAQARLTRPHRHVIGSHAERAAVATAPDNDPMHSPTTTATRHPHPHRRPTASACANRESSARTIRSTRVTPKRWRRPRVPSLHPDRAALASRSARNVHSGMTHPDHHPPDNHQRCGLLSRSRDTLAASSSLVFIRLGSEGTRAPPTPAPAS
ncbi:hypothetical protein DFH07DRAFT_960668 [Mycena maculata]|uniref:Uncharacterized protein n=1 Tax=Mycena maculata TaxID=230809 RepID=A0AAD7NB18_9AGAR|nr:hypothetical protein DFH07DRAFT_960668 [Mycena maculata]